MVNEEENQKVFEDEFNMVGKGFMIVSRRAVAHLMGEESRAMLFTHHEAPHFDTTRTSVSGITEEQHLGAVLQLDQIVFPQKLHHTSEEARKFRCHAISNALTQVEKYGGVVAIVLDQIAKMAKQLAGTRSISIRRKRLASVP